MFQVLLLWRNRNPSERFDQWLFSSIPPENSSLLLTDSRNWTRFYMSVYFRIITQATWATAPLSFVRLVYHPVVLFRSLSHQTLVCTGPHVHICIRHIASWRVIYMACTLFRIWDASETDSCLLLIEPYHYRFETLLFVTGQGVIWTDCLCRHKRLLHSNQDVRGCVRWPMSQYTQYVAVDPNFFQSFPTSLYNAIGDIGTWHASREWCWCVAIGYVRNQFERKLSIL